MEYRLVPSLFGYCVYNSAFGDIKPPQVTADCRFLVWQSTYHGVMGSSTLKFKTLALSYIS